MKRKGILVVSFGTSHLDTMEKTIEVIEQEIQRKFEEYKVYRAFTSGMIIRKLKHVYGIHVDTVKEALKRMQEDGIEEILIQPTHIINGIENDNMLEDMKEYQDSFKSIAVGTPLLSEVDDYKKVVKAIVEEIQLSQDEMLVLMGHGSDHYANASYPMLEYTFHALGHENVYIGTVESFPELQDVMNKLEKSEKKKVVLLAFMLVAGEHAKNDMAGEEDSWKQVIRDAGYEVRVLLKGLGEFPKIRQIFEEHLQVAKG